MLRITRLDGTGGATILRLEGRLIGAKIEEVTEILNACCRDHRQVVIDLAGLTFLDESAAALLIARRDSRVELAGASPFVEELLKGRRT